MARTYKYHVPDAYRGNGGRRPETKRATCSTDPMLDLTHPYFRAAIADFKRFEGIEKDKPLTRRQAKLFEYRVLTGRIRVALPNGSWRKRRTRPRTVNAFAACRDLTA